MIENSFWRDILYEIISFMDPWDVNLSELATRYSDRVEKMEEMDFKIPANVILVSSVLLRMKADLMASIDLNPLEFAREEEGFMFNEFNVEAFSEAGGGYIEDNNILEDADGVPIKVKPIRVTKRRVSATELIAAIQEVLNDKKIKLRLKKEGSVKRVIEVILSKDIKKLIEETYMRVASILSKKKEDEVLFSEMTPERNEIIPTFMSLLHLSNDQKICLKQDKIYDEIFISIKSTTPP